MARRKIVQNPKTRSKVKAYLQIVNARIPDDATVDRFVANFHLLGNLLNDITVEDPPRRSLST